MAEENTPKNPQELTEEEAASVAGGASVTIGSGSSRVTTADGGSSVNVGGVVNSILRTLGDLEQKLTQANNDRKLG